MLLTPEIIFKQVESITPDYLQKNGITALVLDVDNTLTADGSQQLDDSVAAWLDAMRAAGLYADDAGKAIRKSHENPAIQTLYKEFFGEPGSHRAHEVLHTCPGCANHGPAWKGWAAQMNRAYGYCIQTTDTHQALGLVDQRPVRYLVVCSRCGQRLSRMKRSPLVDHPERYRCPCGGVLEVLPVPPEEEKT